MLEELFAPLESPEAYPYDWDARSDTLSFIHLTRAAFAAASFLDARVLTPDTVKVAVPWERVRAGIHEARLPETCHYIFHIGHVGSTLLSRLIGAHPRAFSLREPLLLRGLTLACAAQRPDADPVSAAHSSIDQRIEGCTKLLSRTFERGQQPVVKTTSFVSELAARLLARSAAPRALVMYVTPERYLATILGGPNSRREAYQLTPLRLARLQSRLGTSAWRSESLSEGEAVALGWACEMTALAGAARMAGNRVKRLDFDAFLAAPEVHLGATLAHLGVDPSAAEVAAIVAGPHLQRYSKAQEYAYDAALRQDVLQQARADHFDEIRRGLRWLEHAGARFTAVELALELAAAG